ncbi:MAG: Phosphoenolpyruvate-protein phosphotransferase [Firmicutes bacterium]|nr:Phosphoenolpyruvate-protein phosphotransferase [candidate division NPL-UPA2 bacterium]
MAEGIGVAGGTACGVAYRPSTRRQAAVSVEHVYSAAKRRYERWAEDSSLPATARDLALVYLALLEDPELREAIEGDVTKGRTVGEAITEACEHQARLLDGARHPYLRQRSQDLRALAQELLVMKDEGNYGGILLADSLTPLGLYEAYGAGARGIILRESLAFTSHLAILARTVGLPLVAGVAFDITYWQGQLISIDGASGQIWAGERSFTLQHMDYTPYPLWLNAASARDIAAAQGYKGVGLFRTEFLYLQLGGIPAVEYEEEHYVAAVKAAAGRPVIFRLLDLGSDKPISGLTLDKEPNPMLGERGVRVLLRRRDILERQVRALLVASAHGPLSIMVPMVISAHEMAEVRTVLSELGASHLKLGAMLETPAALLMAEELTGVSDFFSLGTNDLAAYVYACDRAGEMHLPDKAEAMFRLIAFSLRAAKQQGREVGVCGELAADPVYSARFLELGCDYLSMVASAFPIVGKALRGRN